MTKKTRASSPSLIFHNLCLDCLQFVFLAVLISEFSAGSAIIKAEFFFSSLKTLTEIDGWSNFAQFYTRYRQTRTTICRVGRRVVAWEGGGKWFYVFVYDSLSDELACLVPESCFSLCLHHQGGRKVRVSVRVDAATSFMRMFNAGFTHTLTQAGPGCQ